MHNFVVFSFGIDNVDDISIGSLEIALITHLSTPFCIEGRHVEHQLVLLAFLFAFYLAYFTILTSASSLS